MTNRQDVPTTTPGSAGPRTFGVEEELLLVGTGSGMPAPAGERVVDRAPGDTVEQEFKKEQAETGSEPSRTADELLRRLRGLRTVVADAAAGSGASIAAVATSPLRVRPTPMSDERYQRMLETFGVIADQQLTCGQHVHVSIRSRAEGVGVLDRIGPWLPILLALSANSPFWQGVDTGYASYRTVLWGNWPSAVQAVPFGDETGYDRAVSDLVASGAALDAGMIYFDARLSASYPTVEIRVADVCTDVRDAVLIAVLCRALVATCADRWRAGEQALPIRPELRRAAVWRAARYGLTGELLDPRTRRPVPAERAVAALLDELEPALTGTSDLQLAREGTARLLREGTGSEHQRRAGDGGDLIAVVRDAVRRTVAG